MNSHFAPATAIPANPVNIQGYLILLCTVSIWSGAVTVNAREDFHASNLPPKSLYSGGVMPVVDRTVLTEFETLRSQARRACLKVGHRFAGPNLFLVKKDKADELHARLKEIEAQFNDLTENTLLPGLPFLYDAWESLHQQWADVLQRRRPNKDVVRASMQTVIAFSQMTAPTGNAVLEQSFTGMQSMAFLDLCEDVAQRAKEIYQKSFCEPEGNARTVKASVRQTAVNSVRALLDKVEDFASFDLRARPIAQLLQRTLATLPKTGTVSGADLMSMVATLHALSDANQLVADALNVNTQLAQPTAWAAPATAEDASEAETSAAIEDDAREEQQLSLV